MKKLYVLVVLGLLVAPLAKAQVATSTPSDTYFLGDGKGYDVTGSQTVYCFGADTTQLCYSLEGVFVFVRKLDTLITDLQKRVTTLENQPVQPVQQLVGSTPLLTIDTAKGSRVKGEIQSYINGLNGQIEAVNNTKFPDGSLNHNMISINMIKASPTLSRMNWPANAPEYSELISRLARIDDEMRSIQTISFRVDDYLSMGTLLSASDRAYLQSLGINW